MNQMLASGVRSDVSMHTAVHLHSFIHAHTYACIWPQVWRDVLVFVCVCVCVKEAAGVVLVRAHRHMQDAQRSSSPQLQKLSAL